MFSLFAILPLLASSTLALKHAVDSSTLVSQSTFKKALGEGFTKAIPRGYFEACSTGGQVDPNFVGSYNNALAAGYTDIDTYWFPCNGQTNKCKPYAQQIQELSDTFNANKMKIGTIWIDIEKDASVCKNWDYGAAGNLDQAKQLVAAMKASGFKYGIYSTPGEWSTIFGSTSVPLDPTAPLWFATFNNVETLTMGTPFGGWPSAVGHQFTDHSASKQFDLSVFDDSV